MVRRIQGRNWFCCPECGRKIHPVALGARGVFVTCKGKRPDGKKCGWSGEIRCPTEEEIRQTGKQLLDGFLDGFHQKK